MFTIILLCVLAYLIGSISTAIIVCRFAGVPDPRSSGSKNPGATNVLRTAGKKLAIITLLGDVIKGFIPVALVLHLDPRPAVVGLVMLAVFLGHLYPIFFKFEGGKGVATAFGAVLALSWPIGLLLMATWGGMVYFFRISSLGALTAAFLLPFYVYCLEDKNYLIPITLMSLFILWKHKVNIQRLLNGTETRIGNSKPRNS